LNTFDRHLLREWLHILGLVLAATCGLLVVQVCYDDLQSLRNQGATAAELGRYIAITVPSFLAIVLPLALLVSLLYILTKLHRANEFTALRAAGMGFGRLTAPLWVIGVLACGLTWWLNTSLVPWSVEQSQAMKDAISFRHQAIQLPPDEVGAVDDVAFESPGGRRIWFIDRYSEATRRGYGVTISLLDSGRREIDRLVAAQAWHDAKTGGWILRSGREEVFDPETGQELASKPFRERSEPGFAERPSLMLLIGRRPIDLSFFELRRLVRYFARENRSDGLNYAVRYYSLIADTLGPLIAVAIAIPFAVTGVRVNPAVGVSKAIGLYVVYYLLENLAGAAAAKHWVDPIVAAWLPDGGLALLAAWLFARLR
jgi:lipopolysaccharide export system permease protein